MFHTTSGLLSVNGTASLCQVARNNGGRVPNNAALARAVQVSFEFDVM